VTTKTGYHAVFRVQGLNAPLVADVDAAVVPGDGTGGWVEHPSALVRQAVQAVAHIRHILGGREPRPRNAALELLGPARGLLEAFRSGKRLHRRTSSSHTSTIEHGFMGLTSQASWQRRHVTGAKSQEPSHRRHGTGVILATPNLRLYT